MNIAIVSQSYYPRPGGVTEHVHHTATKLRARGHNVTIVTSNFGATPPDLGDVVRIGRNILVPVNSAWVNATVGRHLLRDLGAALEQLNPDVIHTHCPMAPTLPLFTLKVAPRSARVVGTFHAAATRLHAYRVLQPVLRRLIGRLDERVAVSDAAKALAHRYFPGHYTIIPNGVDCQRFTPDLAPIPELRDDAFNVLFVGRLDKRKGLKFLFRAVASLSRKTNRRIRLIVVGENGPRRHLLPRMPRRVEVVMTGVVDRRDLPRYFVTADVFCSPAIERESFGIVLLEAMASGVPVVGTAIPGYLTVLRDKWNARVAPPRSVDGLEQALGELIRDDTLRWRLRSTARPFAEQFDWERVVDRLESVYRGDPITLRAESQSAPDRGPLPAPRARHAQKA